MTMNQPAHQEGINRSPVGAIGEYWALFLVEGVIRSILGVIAEWSRPLRNGVTRRN
jgi:hypothetical protein